MHQSTEKAMVLSSGGIDSSTCLGMAVEKYGAKQVIALSIFYGQKHKRELAASAKVADYYGVKHIYQDLSEIFRLSDCPLLAHGSGTIPKESYADQQKELGGSPVVTYVPFRNGLFLSAAASAAIAAGCSVIYYGAHADDAAGNAYPDCSADFYRAMNEAVWLGSGKQLRLKAPFVGMTKAQVVAHGLSLGVPYALTYSCYEGGEVPCGVCGTCRDRAEAFRLNHVQDPAQSSGPAQ